MDVTTPRKAARPSRVQAVVIGMAGGLGVLVLVLALLPLWGFRVVALTTGSMSPGLPPGSVILTRDVAAVEVSVGDVVTVTRASGDRVTHRVVSVEAAGTGARIELKGDANGQPDPSPYLVTRVGLAVASIPFGGAVLLWAGQAWVAPALAGAVCLLVLWAWWPRRPQPAHRRTDAREELAA